jgi:branched-chain amino acid transport system substrate-binding protein
MALEEFNRTSERKIALATTDSKGAPGRAVKAVRKLVLEDGAVGILGSVFTVPTISASIEANAWKTPLLSPVVSAKDLTDIGPWVFETKVPSEVEVIAVVNMAVTELRLERYAVVAPSSGQRRALAELFHAEVTRLGGEIVVSAYYEEGATDFREQLEAVWDAAPEAIFVPASVEELLTLLPQVKFYDLQVQLLGLSNWNSEKLLRLYSGELEGALFPLETYHGKDPDAYRRFKQALEGKGTVDVSPITVAGYFGMRLLLDAIAAGASNRDEIRTFLDDELHRDAEGRFLEARTLSILTVRSGKTVEFKPPRRSGF